MFALHARGATPADDDDGHAEHEPGEHVGRAVRQQRRYEPSALAAASKSGIVQMRTVVCARFILLPLPRAPAAAPRSARAALAACGGDDADVVATPTTTVSPSEAAPGEELFAFVSQVTTQDATTTFLALTDTVPQDTLDLSDAMELSGFGDVFGFGDKLYVSNGETFEIQRHRLESNQLAAGAAMSLSGRGLMRSADSSPRRRRCKMKRYAEYRLDVTAGAASHRISNGSCGVTGRHMAVFTGAWIQVRRPPGGARPPLNIGDQGASAWMLCAGLRAGVCWAGRGRAISTGGWILRWPRPMRLHRAMLMTGVESSVQPLSLGNGVMNGLSSSMV